MVLSGQKCCLQLARTDRRFTGQPGWVSAEVQSRVLGKLQRYRNRRSELALIIRWFQGRGNKRHKAKLPDAAVGREKNNGEAGSIYIGERSGAVSERLSWRGWFLPCAC